MDHSSIVALWLGLSAAAAPAALVGQERRPIDLGDMSASGTPPAQIDLLAPPPGPEAPTAAAIKDCTDQQDAGIVADEIVVCREIEGDSSQLFSGTREEWLKRYAARTQGANTIPPPDVAGEGIFRGPATISGLCFIPPCPEDPALIVDVTAIPPPPAGSDAERVAQGLAPLEGDTAPISDEARRRIDEELGLPAPPAPGGAEG